MRRLLLIFLSSMLLGLFCLHCQKGTAPDADDPHAVVGRWEALAGRRVISFSDDGSAMVHGLRARWRAIEASSVRIDYKKLFIPDMEFRVSSSNDGELVGILLKGGREVKDSSGGPRIYKKVPAPGNQT